MEETRLFVKILVAVCAAALVIVYSCVELSGGRERPTWQMSDDSASGVSVRWKQLPVRWSFLCGSDVIPEFRDGFQWWNDRYDGGIFVEVPQEQACLCSDAGACPQLIVLEGLNSQDINFIYPDGGPFDAGIEAPKSYARTQLHLSGPFITGAAIRYFNAWGDANDEARKTITRHEVGHALGLLHSSIEECLMYPTVAHDADRVKDICPGEEQLFTTNYGR